MPVGRAFHLFGYGATLPEPVREVLKEFDRKASAGRSKQEQLKLVLQALIGVWLVLALAFYLAEMGLIGLSVIILTTSLCGVTDEHTIGKAFQEALPFTTLVTVFFAVVAMIIEHHLFSPVIQYVLQASPVSQLSLFYLFNGLLSSVSDNVLLALSTSMKRVPLLRAAPCHWSSSKCWRSPLILALICHQSLRQMAKQLFCFC